MRKLLYKPAIQELPKTAKFDVHYINNLNVEKFVTINTKSFFGIITYHTQAC